MLAVEIDSYVDRLRRQGVPFVLLLVDLDNLKVVNDRDGHAAGDDMLVSMADTMRELCRREDLLYRINTIEIELPPLRERLDDLPDLIASLPEEQVFVENPLNAAGREIAD